MKLEPIDTGQFTIDKRVESLLRSQDYGDDYVRLMRDAGWLLRGYLTSRLHDLDWRGRYTAGFKRPLADIASAMDQLAAGLAELLPVNPDIRDKIMSPELAELLKKELRRPRVVRRDINAPWEDGAAGKPARKHAYEDHQEKWRGAAVRRKKDSECYPQGQRYRQQD